MVELSAFDDRVLGLPMRLGLQQRLPPALLLLELETILAFTAGAALVTGVVYWPAYSFPLTLFGLAAGVLSAESPGGAGARLLVYFGYFEMASLLLDMLWLLSNPVDGNTISWYASAAVGLTMCLKLLVMVKIGERLQEAGLLGVPPGGGGLPGPVGSSLPGTFPGRRGRPEVGHEAFLPPRYGPHFRDGANSYEYDPDALDSAAPNTAVFDSEASQSAGLQDAVPIKLPSP